MKKVTIEIDDKYGESLSVTVIGLDGSTARLTSQCIDLSKGTYLSVDSNANWKQRKTLAND